MTVPYLACMALVANVYALPPRVLPAIQRIEGGHGGSVSINRNGSEDYGVMQVNSTWLPALSQYTGLSQTNVRQQLIIHDCFNIAAAGLILRTELDAAHGDLLTAVGNYHSHTPVHHFHYRTQVLAAARELFQPGSRPVVAR